MPERDYQFNFHAPSGPLKSDLDQVEAKLKGLLTLAAQFEAKLDKLGGTSAGLQTFIGQLNKVEAELKAAGSNANTAENALQKVGTGNRGLTSMSKRVATLTAELNALKLSAAGAGGATAGIGSGPGGLGGRGLGPGGEEGSGMSGMAGIASKAITIGAMAAGMAASSIGAAGKAKGEDLSEVGKEAAAFRESLLPLANLRGMKMGPDANLVREQLAFQKETGLPADVAKDFSLEFEGAIEGGKKAKNITPEVAKDLEREAARFAARYDLDAKSAGRLAGLMPLYQKIGSGEEGGSKLAMMAEHLNLLGVGEVKNMIGPINSMSATMLNEAGGRFTDPVKMAARFAATTIKSGGNASVAKSAMERTNRAIRRFDNPAIAETLEGAGISPTDDYETAIRKMEIPIRAAGPQADIWLAKHGFKNSKERADIRSQVDLNQIVDEQNKDPRIQAAGRTAAADNLAFQKSEVGAARQAQIADFSARVEEGMTAAPLEQARLEATTALRREKKLKATGWAGPLEDTLGWAMAFGSQTGEAQRVDQKVLSMFDARAKKVGITDATKNLREIDWGGTVGVGGAFGMPGLGGKDQDAFANEFMKQQMRVAQAEQKAARQAPGAAGGVGQQLVQLGQQAMQVGQQLDGQQPAGKPGDPVIPGRK